MGSLAGISWGDLPTRSIKARQSHGVQRRSRKEISRQRRYACRKSPSRPVWPGGVGPVAVSPATEKDAENLTLFGLPRLDPDFPSIGDTLRQPLSVGSVAEGAKLQRDGRSRGRRRSNGLGCRTVGRLRDGGRLRNLDDG